MVPCAARRSSSHTRIGPTLGSRSRKRCTSCTAKAPLERLRFRSGASTRVGAELRSGRRCPAGDRPARRLPRARAAAHDALGEAAQIFDQHDAQRDGHGPEFADRERLHALVRGHETAQHFGIEAAIGVRDECPGDSEDARISLQVTGGKFRQFAIKARRQVVANFAKLLFDDVEIVDQPFRRGSDGLFLLNGAREWPGSIPAATRPFSMHARNQRPPLPGIRYDGLGSGQAFGVLLQTLDAEKFGANRLLRLGKNWRRRLGRLSHLLVSFLHSLLCTWPEICARPVSAGTKKQEIRRPTGGSGRTTQAPGLYEMEFYRTERSIER